MDGVGTYLMKNCKFKLEGVKIIKGEDEAKPRWKSINFHLGLPISWLVKP